MRFIVDIDMTVFSTNEMIAGVLANLAENLPKLPEVWPDANTELRFVGELRNKSNGLIGTRAMVVEDAFVTEPVDPSAPIFTTCPGPGARDTSHDH